jgi:hypothetical protein
MEPEPRIFGEISCPIGTEIFSPVLDTNNVLHYLYTRVLILRESWAGRVACKVEQTYTYNFDQETRRRESTSKTQARIIIKLILKNMTGQCGLDACSS